MTACYPKMNLGLSNHVCMYVCLRFPPNNFLSGMKDLDKIL
jgi:hypothetical protein